MDASRIGLRISGPEPEATAAHVWTGPDGWVGRGRGRREEGRKRGRMEESGARREGQTKLAPPSFMHVIGAL